MSRPAFPRRSFPKTTWGKVQRRPPLPPRQRQEKPAVSIGGGAGGSVSFGTLQDSGVWAGATGGTGGAIGASGGTGGHAAANHQG